MWAARSTRESRGYKDFTGEPDGISNINRRIILKYTLKPPQLQVEWTDLAEYRFSVNPAGSIAGNKFPNWPRGYYLPTKNSVAVSFEGPHRSFKQQKSLQNKQAVAM
jgi:hypothetical protein